MKRIKEMQFVFLPILSAIFLGLSRLSVNLDALVFVAFIPLFYYFENCGQVLKKVNLKSDSGFLKQFKIGALFSTVFLLISIHWISIVTLPGFMGILLIFGVVFGVLFWILSLMYKFKPVLYYFSLISGWLSFEYATNFTEFRYPWFNVAYGLDNSLKLIQLAEYGGITLIGLLVLVINYILYLAIVKNRNYFILGFSLIVIWYVIGTYRINTIQLKETDLKIAVVQGSIEQEDKWLESMVDSTFAIYHRLAKEAVEKDSVDFVIFPEAALPVYLMQRNFYYYRFLDMVFDVDVPIFTGFPHYRQERKYKGQPDPFLYYNAANLFDPNTLADSIYYKNILVPYGERTPFLDILPVLWKLQFGQANFEKGENPGLYRVKDYSFSPLICFEIVFPLYLRMINDRYNPDFWVNITNDAWFKRSIGTQQHASMAIFRSIETRKSVFRSANTGYSFYTNPIGEIHKKTELYERTYIAGNLVVYDKLTAYVRYGFILPFLFFLFFALQIINLVVILFLRKFVW